MPKPLSSFALNRRFQNDQRTLYDPLSLLSRIINIKDVTLLFHPAPKEVGPSTKKLANPLKTLTIPDGLIFKLLCAWCA